MIVSESGRRPRLSVLAVGAFVAGFLALMIASPAQKTRSDDATQSPATPLSADENPAIRKSVERLAHERYLFLKRLGQNLQQAGFFATYALFPVGRYDRVYILEFPGDGYGHIHRYDHKESRDKHVYAARLNTAWSFYNGRIRNLVQVIKTHHAVLVGKISRFARHDLSQKQELVQYTWIPYTDTVEIRLSSRLNDNKANAITLSDTDTNPERSISGLLSENIVKKNGLPISREELALIKER